MVIKVSDLRNTKDGRTYADLSDRMLVLDFQAGNPEAFVEIHRRYAGLARHVSQRILGNPDDADEAAQETMIRVFRGLARFNGRYALQPWVARIATNVSLDLTRARARRPPIGDRPIHELGDDRAPHVEDGTDETVERLLECDRVQEVLSSMPSRHRDALVLREFEGLSHKEIGEALGVTPPQAKALIHRAKGTFRRLWDGRDEDHRGLAAFFPFILLDKLFGLFRRVADRASETGQQIATSPVAAAAASNPIIPAATSQTAERVVAAATITAIVAGGVTVGAATLSRRKAEPVAASPSPSVRVIPPPPVTIRETKPTVKKPKADRHPVGAPTESPTQPPTEAPSPAPTGSPTGSPTSEPTPTEPAPPVVGPPPTWTSVFRVSSPSEETCDCDPGMSLSSSTYSGELTAEEGLDVRQDFSGAALDGEGNPAWGLTAGIFAHLEAGEGHLNLFFSLAGDYGVHQYSGSVSSADSVTGVPGDAAPVFYTFSGFYVLEQGSSDTSPIGDGGAFVAKVSVWGDGTTVYLVEVLLQGA